MPELPEVETVVRDLAKILPGQKIKLVNVFCAKLITFEPHLLQNCIIRSVERRGKYIIFVLDDGYLIAHLRMTGKLFAVPKQESLQSIHQRHLHVLFELENYNLLFQDQRKFGQLWLSSSLEWLEQKLGPEPLSNSFTLSILTNICRSRRALKPLLLDQSQIAGLGNIYVDEVLWHAGLHPQTSAGVANPIQLQKLYEGIQSILMAAIARQGTTFLSYTFAGEKHGSYLSELKVFSRAGKSCKRCGAIIIKIKVAQRGTFVCPSCQQFEKES